ncbi:PadR family transcriptional regulator [Companilactobacillus mishanensis]|uniref:PadR family transcriptional regulator n=1 Tax=Companilactobacillus mishanensis TaxID=2486008 RepID=A0A5P0ZJP5_9LACO|nr:PadR family transcriptional regulator [Companilactobacillus mishanensis]MQS53268.1 PadR family transcriptional regulator [Companilactobacillus mishanensis]
MAQKNRLQYIVLGLLNIESRTGYDLTKSFDSDIGEFWSANHSQIYPLLKKMEQENLISHHEVQVGTKLVKKSYDIMSDGKKIFNAWLEEPSEIDSSHDEFILKLYFIDDKKSELLEKMVAEQLSVRSDKLEHLNQQMRDKFPDQDKRQTQYGHYCVLKHAISRETDYIEWLKTI